MRITNFIYFSYDKNNPSQLHWDINCDRAKHCDAKVLKENLNVIIEIIISKCKNDPKKNAIKKDTRLVERFSCDVVPGRYVCLFFFNSPIQMYAIFMYVPRHLCMRLFGVWVRFLSFHLDRVCLHTATHTHIRIGINVCTYMYIWARARSWLYTHYHTYAHNKPLCISSSSSSSNTTPATIKCVCISSCLCVMYDFNNCCRSSSAVAYILCFVCACQYTAMYIRARSFSLTLFSCRLLHRYFYMYI